MTIAVVPLRDPGRGKTRLATPLTHQDRSRLAVAMAHDVVTALRGSGLRRIILAAGGPRAHRLGTSLDVEVVRDPHPGGGLDGAIAATVARLAPDEHVLVVAADLPAVTSEEITTVAAHDAKVVVAATQGGGTGGLLRRPGQIIPTAYGAGSAQEHLRLATASGVSNALLTLAGFMHDVDTAADLDQLTASEEGGSLRIGPHTSAWLKRWWRSRV